MKKFIKREMEVEICTCNICGEEINNSLFNESRIDLVKYLFNTKDFDAHEKCINGVVKEAFKKYFPDYKEPENI